METKEKQQTLIYLKRWLKVLLKRKCRQMSNRVRGALAQFPSKLPMVLSMLPMVPSSNRPKLFPFELIVTMPILFLVAVSLLGTVAKDVEDTLKDSYALSLTQADVICDQLAVYGSSVAMDCATRRSNRGLEKGKSVIPKQLTEFLETIGIVAQESVTVDSQVIKPKEKVLYPNDLATLMLASGLIDEEVAEVPESILDVEGGGPATWIAHAWISPCAVSGKPISPDRASYGPLVTLHSDGLEYSTIEAVLATMCKLGLSENSLECGDGTLKGVCKEDVEYITERMTAGDSLQEIVKWVMVKYGLDVKYDATSKPKRVPDVAIKPFAVQVSNDPTQPIYEPKGTEVLTEATYWGKDNPWALRDAAFKFSYFLLTQVSQESEVKQTRFAYKALIGPLQRAILLLILFIGLVLIARLVITAIAFLGIKVSTFLFWGFGNVKNLPRERWEAELESSGKATGQLLDLLPLLGLFGTVIGILKGLPNAASVVVSSGPLGNESVQILFEQLGLAFGTTAIALGGVIALQPIWTVLQEMERRILIRLLA